MWPQRWWQERKPLLWLETESQTTQWQQELWEGSSGEQPNNEGLARSLLPLEAPVLQAVSL